MILAKLFLILLLTFLFLFFSLTDKYHTIKKIMIFISYLFGILLIIFPPIAISVAKSFNIVDSNNVILYLIIGVLTLIIGTLYAKTKDNRAITKIVREIAITNYIKTEESKEKID